MPNFRNIPNPFSGLQQRVLSDEYVKDLGKLPCGEIWFKDNTTPITLNSAGEVQITDFDNNGESYNTSPDHTSNDITIDISGRYLIIVSLTVINDSPISHVVDVSVFKNNGTIELQNLHSHRSLAGGSGDVGAMSLSGIITLTVNDTVEIWAITDSGVDRDVIFEDCTLTIIKIEP